MLVELFKRVRETRLFLSARLLAVAALLAAVGLAVNAAAQNSDEAILREAASLNTSKSTKAAADNFRGNGWWWGGPSLSGTGFFVEAQGDRGFVTFFMYDDAGKATWYAASGVFSAQSGTSFTFSGDLLNFRGGQPASSNTPSAPTSQSVGTLSINFSSATTATVQLPSRSFAAQRFDFGGLNGAITGNQPETGWYWNASQAGRGYAVEVQNGTMFLTMFHYNTDGSPTWNFYTGPIGTNGLFTGDFAGITGGQTLGGAYRSPNPATPTPGFSGSFTSPCLGTLKFPGNPVQTSITRFSFGVSDVTACRSTGGGGGGNTSGIVYKTTGTAVGVNAAIQAMNQQGATGFAYVSPLAHQTNAGSGQSPNFEYFDLFAKGQANTTYSYKAVIQAANAAGLASQLNTEGAAGFLFKGPTYFATLPAPTDPVYLLLVKTSARNTTYSYRVTAIAGPSELNVGDLNAEGNAGYSYRGNYFIGGLYYRIHIKDNGSGATYNYLATPAIDSPDDLLNQMNTQGAQNYMYKGGFFTGVSTVSVYEKVSTTTSPIVFVKTASGPTVSAAELLAKADPFGEQGFLFWGNLAFANPTQYALYFYKGPPSAHPLYGPIFP
jgi:hypothetical protein